VLAGVVSAWAFGCEMPDPEMVKVCEHQQDLWFEGPGRDNARQAKVDTCVESGKKFRKEAGAERWKAMKACMLASTTKAEYEACSTGAEKETVSDAP
jgi:hypothetical protein